jgi:hypothetical protein
VKSAIHGCDRDPQRARHILDACRLLSLIHATGIVAQLRDFTVYASSSFVHVTAKVRSGGSFSKCEHQQIAGRYAPHSE